MPPGAQQEQGEKIWREGGWAVVKPKSPLVAWREEEKGHGREKEEAVCGQGDAETTRVCSGHTDA